MIENIIIVILLVNIGWNIYERAKFKKELELILELEKVEFNTRIKLLDTHLNKIESNE